MPTLRYQYPIGSMVQLVVARTEEDLLPGMITGVGSNGGSPCYTISWGSGEDTRHFEFELRPYKADDDWRASLNAAAE